MGHERKGTRGGMGFLLIVAVLVYAMLSAAIALTTVKTCGQASSPKHWVFAPPHWECDATTNFIVR